MIIPAPIIPWLILVPFIIFAVKPSAPMWHKGGRILFLLFVLMIPIWVYDYIYPDPPRPGPPRCCKSETQYMIEDFLFRSIYIMVLANTYIGWWEILWRSIYKQWSKKIMETYQFGVISMLCVIGSGLVTTSLLFLAWIWLIHWRPH